MGRHTVCHVEGTPCLTSTEGCACVRSISNLYSGRVYGGVQRSGGRHSSTRDHLVSEGLWELGSVERVVRVLGLSTIDPQYCKRLSRLFARDVAGMLSC